MAVNILIVDDSAVMREMIARAVALSGVGEMKILHAPDGKAALDIVKNNDIDLVIADLNMPHMGGEELMERLRSRQKTKDLPVIIASTETSPEKIKLLEDKCRAFVHKPFSPEEIGRAVRGALGGRP